MDNSIKNLHLKFLERFFEDMVCNSKVLIILLIICVGEFGLNCCRCIGVRSIHVVVHKQVSVFKPPNYSAKLFGFSFK